MSENHNRKRIKLANDMWVSTPDEYDLEPGDEIILAEIGELVARMTSRKIHAIHLNKDREKPEAIHSVNVVLHKEE